MLHSCGTGQEETGGIVGFPSCKRRYGGADRDRFAQLPYCEGQREVPPQRDLSALRLRILECLGSYHRGLRPRPRGTGRDDAQKRRDDLYDRRRPRPLQRSAGGTHRQGRQPSPHPQAGLQHEGQHRHIRPGRRDDEQGGQRDGEPKGALRGQSEDLYL